MKIALYPGTFDPFTKGHLDIALRAARQFDKLIIAVSEHERKQTLFTLEERIHSIEAVIKGQSIENVTVEGFSNLLASFAIEKGASIVIRGLRVTSDFEYEFKMAQFNNEMNPGLEVIYLMSTAAYLHVSSTSVKEIASLGGDVSAYVPVCVKQMLDKAKF
ncbi:MAG: pantetheine-phosphate adenylyltransferase [Alphaproteobacteria bacterium]